MKDNIYNIPVTDAFSQDCECPLCVLEKRLEQETVDYMLGGSLMEADCRLVTNEHGFCRRHLESLFNSKLNVLGLGLILSTHLAQLNQDLQMKYTEMKKNDISQPSLLKSIFSSKSSEDKNENMSNFLNRVNLQQEDCTICSRLSKTLNRYVGVMFHMWKTEPDFRDIFNKKKGFCMKHFKMLLNESEGFLNNRQRLDFLDILIPQQLENLNRLQEEVTWFTQMFDYKNSHKSWGESKDSVQRAIEKLNGYAKLE